MKTELRLRPHEVLPGQSVIELWFDGRFIGQVTGADGPGIRLMTVRQINVGQLDLRPDVKIAELLLPPDDDEMPTQAGSNDNPGAL